MHSYACKRDAERIARSEQRVSLASKEARTSEKKNINFEQQKFLEEKGSLLYDAGIAD